MVQAPAQKIRTKGGNELEFDSIEPNKTGVSTPLIFRFIACFKKFQTVEHNMKWYSFKYMLMSSNSQLSVVK